MAQLHFDGTIFWFHCTHAERRLPERARFRFHATRKKWYTKDPAVAFQLRVYAVGDARKFFDKASIQITPWLKPLPPSPFLYPVPPVLFPHQIEAMKFALERNRCYLGMDAGLGKTPVAATVIRALNAFCLYVTPPFLVENVYSEFRTWAPEHTPEIVRDTQLEAYQHDDFFKPEPNHVLIVDEAHRFKNGDAKRTKALFKLAAKFDRVIFMSGTPMPNRPIELYEVLSHAAPETINFMSFFDFGRRYCAGYKNDYGWDFSGASNVHELAWRVIAPKGPFMLRQKKELLDLPPKLEEIFVISDTMSARLQKLETKVGREYSTAEDAIKHQLAAAEGKEDLHLGTYRRLLGIEKVKASVEYLKSLLEETDEAIIVGAYHTKVIEKLYKKLEDWLPLVITGKTPTKDRHKIVKEFQKRKQRRLIIGNYQAMGIGFTLTKATRVFSVEFSWVPGENSQFSDRAHRIGQKKTVLHQFACYENSLDRKVIATLLKKRKTIENL